MTGKYKAVFIDIDGTLVDDEKRISEETVQTLKRLNEKGINLILTSGKPSKSIEGFSRKCYAAPFLIGSNGAIVKNFESGTDIFSKTIDKELVLKILIGIKENNLYTMITAETGNLLVDERKYGMEPHNRSEVIITDSLIKFCKEPQNSILKFTVISQDYESLNIFRNTIVNIPSLYVFPIERLPIPKSFWQPKENEIAVPYSIDITAGGVSKKEGIEVLCNYLKIDKSQTIGIGDGLNDLEMFQAVGFKIAMANAAEETKKTADMITDSNNESGVAKALNKIFN